MKTKCIIHNIKDCIRDAKNSLRYEDLSGVKSSIDDIENLVNRLLYGLDNRVLEMES